MHRNLRHLAFAMTLLAGAASAPAHAQQAPITDAESLIRAMHGRYAGKWYRTLTFTQKTTTYPPGGRPPVEDTWLEYGALPGRLRIEFQKQGGGAIFANDSSYRIGAGGVVEMTTGRRNDLMTLGFDVYTQAPEITLRQLGEAGFSLASLRTDTWQDRPVYVVGAPAGDLRTKQFWIDAERLVFVRMLVPIPNQTTAQDIRFNDYQPLGGGWIAPEVEIVVDGRRVFHEVYSDIRHDVPLDPSLFDPKKWNEAVHPPGAR